MLNLRRVSIGQYVWADTRRRRFDPRLWVHGRRDVSAYKMRAHSVLQAERKLSWDWRKGRHRNRNPDPNVHLHRGRAHFLHHRGETDSGSASTRLASKDSRPSCLDTLVDFPELRYLPLVPCKSRARVLSSRQTREYFYVLLLASQWEFDLDSSHED